jgi:putative transposase
VGRDSVEPTKEHCGRENPATGVYSFPGNPTIVFLTVCTLQRATGLADRLVIDALIEAWKSADAWKVGHFVLMPDHIHLFCSRENDEVEIENWIAFWKRKLRRLCPSAPRFQSRGFHHRLRRSESYEAKIDYVLKNPVRAGLVKSAEQRPYQGRLNHLSW